MKYSIDTFRKHLPFKVSKGISMDNIKSFSDDEDFNAGQLDFDVYLPTKGMNLQRDLVWTPQQKSELIISVLKGIELQVFSAIQFKPRPGCNYNERIIKIIDGKQRLTTLISYYRNEFPILWEGKEIYFEDLDDYAKAEIWNYTPKFDLAYEYGDKLIPDDDKIKWFEMINFAGTPQDINHLNALKTK